MNYELVIYICVAVLSFILGRKFGRQQVFHSLAMGMLRTEAMVGKDGIKKIEEIIKEKVRGE